MQLYGSTTSPYVRRLRIWLANESYEFVKVDIMSKEGHQVLKQNTPVLKVPFLIDGEQKIYDSKVIYRYLNQKLDREAISWDDENKLTMIDGANDSFVEIFLLARSGVGGDDIMFIQRQQKRITLIMEQLDKLAQDGGFDQWQFPAMCLYCLLDWITFRELYDISPFPSLVEFHKKHQQNPEVVATFPQV